MRILNGLFDEGSFFFFFFVCLGIGWWGKKFPYHFFQGFIFYITNVITIYSFFCPIGVVCKIFC